MIRVRDLQKTFHAGTPNAVIALRDVCLEVPPGQFVTLIGTNGSGKSTLLNAIAGAFLPEKGQVEIAGRNVTRSPDFRRAREVARVFQNPFSGTAPALTIAENLHLADLRGRRYWPWIGLTAACRRDYQAQVEALEMQLEERLDNLIGTLSGGQRQALTLLMAVRARPKVLLLDEHTAALDPKSAAQVIRLTRRFIERDGLTALMVTHSMQQALELGDRLIMMYHGRIIDDLPAETKRQLTVDDLLEKFEVIRQAERLTPELAASLSRQYR